MFYLSIAEAFKISSVVKACVVTPFLASSSAILSLFYKFYFIFFKDFFLVSVLATTSSAAYMFFFNTSISLSMPLLVFLPLITFLLELIPKSYSICFFLFYQCGVSIDIWVNSSIASYDIVLL
jgi:hypothetical protein